MGNMTGPLANLGEQVSLTRLARVVIAVVALLNAIAACDASAAGGHEVPQEVEQGRDPQQEVVLELEQALAGEDRARQVIAFLSALTILDSKAVADLSRQETLGASLRQAFPFHRWEPIAKRDPSVIRYRGEPVAAEEGLVKLLEGIAGTDAFNRFEALLAMELFLVRHEDARRKLVKNPGWTRLLGSAFRRADAIPKAGPCASMSQKLALDTKLQAVVVAFVVDPVFGERLLRKAIESESEALRAAGLRLRQTSFATQEVALVFADIQRKHALLLFRHLLSHPDAGLRDLGRREIRQLVSQFGAEATGEVVALLKATYSAQRTRQSRLLQIDVAVRLAPDARGVRDWLREVGASESAHPTVREKALSTLRELRLRKVPQDNSTARKNLAPEGRERRIVMRDVTPREALLALQCLLTVKEPKLRIVAARELHRLAGQLPRASRDRVAGLLRRAYTDESSWQCKLAILHAVVEIARTRRELSVFLRGIATSTHENELVREYAGNALSALGPIGPCTIADGKCDSNEATNP